jgi:hypothetical protein
MNKEQVIAMMMESINSDNKQMCLDMGMSEEESNKKIEGSQMGLFVMVSNIYDKLVEANLIVV